MFHPNMKSIVEGFSPSSGPKWRSWNGMLADVWEVSTAPGACGEYVSPHARLFVMLDETQNGSLQLAGQRACSRVGAGRLTYVPPDMRIWSFAPQQAQLRHLDLHIDLRLLATRLGVQPDDPRLLSPRFMFDSERILTLARLLAEDCASAERHDLYGEGIANAILVELFQLGPQPQDQRGRLSPRRLRLATQYLEARCYEAVGLVELADLVGLSPSYFSSAFKASTGVTPHQWQMQMRLERVKSALSDRKTSLSEVAAQVGFADQAHLTRVFKQYVGLTPAAWRRGQD